MSEVLDLLKGRIGVDAPIYRAVAGIDRLARKHGYRLSRWESRRGAKLEIRYVVHTGRRTSYYKNLAPGSIVAQITLTTPEGTTAECAAMNEIDVLLRYMRYHRP